MAVTEKQFDRLEDRVSNAFERIAKLEGANGVVPKAPNAMLITLLSIIGVAVVGYWAWIGVQVVDHGKSLATINAVLAPATLR